MTCLLVEDASDVPIWAVPPDGNWEESRRAFRQDVRAMFNVW